MRPRLCPLIPEKYLRTKTHGLQRQFPQSLAAPPAQLHNKIRWAKVPRERRQPDDATLLPQWRLSAVDTIPRGTQGSAKMLLVLRPALWSSDSTAFPEASVTLSPALLPRLQTSQHSVFRREFLTVMTERKDLVSRKPASPGCGYMWDWALQEWQGCFCLGRVLSASRRWRVMLQAVPLKLG